MTFDEFKVLVKAMKSAYTTPNFLPDESSVKLWFNMLQDLPYELATESIKRYILKNKFPPTVADIREVSAELQTTEQLDWSESWQLTLRLISSYGLPNEQKAYEKMDYNTLKTVKRLGWKNLCMSQNQTADRANYRTIYETVSKETKENLALPQEIRNKLLGE